jgi:hypothetical protein
VLSANEARPGRIRVPSLHFQLLWDKIEIHTPASEVVASLRFLAQSARQRVTVLKTTTFEILPDSHGYLVLEGEEHRSIERTALAVLEVLYQRVHARAFARASRAGWVRAHAAVVETGGRRLLLAGTTGVGKTTLALRLLFDGAVVHCDESSLLRGGATLAVPRPFHLKPTVERYVPEIVPLLPEMPVVTGDVAIRAFDPGRAGFEWEISPGPVDAVVMLTRGENTRLERVEATRVMHDIVADVFLLNESKATVVREVATVLRHAACYALEMGDVGQASGLVRSLGE